ncbi:hypothetical protein STEG23_017698 [Scotinomys teguina]
MMITQDIVCAVCSSQRLLLCTLATAVATDQCQVQQLKQRLSLQKLKIQLKLKLQVPPQQHPESQRMLKTQFHLLTALGSPVLEDLTVGSNLLQLPEHKSPKDPPWYLESGSRTDEFGRNRRRLKKFHGKPGCGSHHSPTFQEESMSPGTSTVVSIPKTNSSLEASVHDDQNLQDAGCSPQEDLLDGQALTAAPNPRQPTVVEAQTDPSMTEGSASVEAPVPTTAAARGP